MTAKVHNISLDIVTTPIALCLSETAYIKALNRYNLKLGCTSPGMTSFITTDSVLNHIIVYIDADTDKYCIYDIKGLVVHELNHVLTRIFEYFGFTCDETRSYMMQYLYIKCMKILDKELNNAK